MASIKVTGKNGIDQDIRLNALKSINKNLSTSQLQKINELATNDKARDFIDNKFNMLKSFL